jgi:hypothetical protein
MIELLLSSLNDVGLYYLVFRSIYTFSHWLNVYVPNKKISRLFHTRFQWSVITLFVVISFLEFYQELYVSAVIDMVIAGTFVPKVVWRCSHCADDDDDNDSGFRSRILKWIPKFTPVHTPVRT